MNKPVKTSSTSVQTTTKVPKKASVRGSTTVTNPTRRKMTIPISESFEKIHDMNRKALKILAKRA